MCLSGLYICQCLLCKHFQVICLLSHETIDSPIHLDSTQKRKSTVRPMPDSRAVKPVRKGPSTHIWVYCDTRVCRGAKCVRCRSLSRQANGGNQHKHGKYYFFSHCILNLICSFLLILQHPFQPDCTRSHNKADCRNHTL